MDSRASGSLANKRELIDEASICRRESQLVMLLGEDGIARMYVPQGRRDALIEAHHVSIGHLAADKTHGTLARNYSRTTQNHHVGNNTS